MSSLEITDPDTSLPPSLDIRWSRYWIVFWLVAVLECAVLPVALYYGLRFRTHLSLSNSEQLPIFLDPSSESIIWCGEAFFSLKIQRSTQRDRRADLYTNSGLNTMLHSSIYDNILYLGINTLHRVLYPRSSTHSSLVQHATSLLS